MKIIKKLSLLFIIILLFACNANNREIIKFIKGLDNKSLINSLKELKLKNKAKIVFENADYYYIVARKYYDLYGFDDYFKYFIEEAINKDNIFNSEALDFYINSLILEEGFSYLKEIIKTNKDKLDLKYKDFLIDFSLGKNLSSINSIYNEERFFPLLCEIIKYSGELSEDDNKKIVNFFMNGKIDKNYYIKHKLKFEDIIIAKSNNKLIKLFYSFVIDDKENFILLLDDTIATASPDELFFIRDMSKKFKVYSDFYNSLSKLAAKRNDPVFLYSYGIVLIEFNSKSLGIATLKKVLNMPSDLSIKNYETIIYEIRARILYSDMKITNQWISDVVNFVNDYPSKYFSRDLLLLTLRTLLDNGNGTIFIPFINKVNVSGIPSPYRAVYYYLIYLIDKDNQSKYLTLLKKDFPLSYPTLRFTNGYIGELKKTPSIKINVNNSINIKKALYYFDFSMIDDVRKTDLSSLKKEEMLFIFSELANHYENNENYYNAIKFNGEYAAELYGDEIVDIDIETLHKLFPLYYHDIVREASLEFGIEEALIFAVIREESRFAKEILSHANAKGLMQIIAPTAEFIAKKIGLDSYDLSNPKDNIRMGTFYLKYIFESFDEVEYVLASYNAGTVRANRWKKAHKNYDNNVKYEIIPIEETRHYIRKVLRSYYIYKYILSMQNGL